MSTDQDILDRKLATAVASLKPEHVAGALKEGGDPNVYSVNRSHFPIEIAAWTWNGSGASKARQDAAGTIIDMLLDAGADPLAYHRGKSPLFNANICAHPRCREIILQAFPGQAHAIRQLDQDPETRHWGSAYYLTRVAATPLHKELLDHFRSINLDPEIWWQAGFGAQTPDLMSYVVESREKFQGGAPSIKWMTRSVSWLAPPLPKRPDGILVWLNHLSEHDQVKAMLGEPPAEGILVGSIKKYELVRDAIWDYALNHKHIVKAIKERGMLKGLLALSVLGKPQHSLKILKMALKEGVDVASMSIQDARLVKEEIPDWDRPSDEELTRASPQATLLAGHLLKTSRSASVALLRALVKAGVKPDHEALCGLCMHMTYSAKEKRYLPLFDEWTTRQHVDPMPEGETPAWEYITLMRPETASRKRFQDFLEARHLEWRMQRSIHEPEQIQSLKKRTVGVRL